MSTKHTVTDCLGNVHTRTSEHRIYTHCIVVHFPARLAEKDCDDDVPAHSKAVSWASSLKLAEKAARYWARAHPVEILQTKTGA